MIRRSSGWPPLCGYGFIAAVFSALATAPFVVAAFVRNPVSALLGIFSLAIWLPIFFLCFIAITGLAVVIFVVVRVPLPRVSARWRQAVLISVAAAAGVPVTFVVWLCVEVAAPSAWAVAAGAVLTAAAFGWYARLYETAEPAARPEVSSPTS